MTLKEEISELRKDLRAHVLADERVIQVIHDRMSETAEIQGARLDSIVTVNSEQLTLLQSLASAARFSITAAKVIRWLIYATAGVLAAVESYRHLKP